ncbi:MAG: hypothetical protein WCP31_04800 [Chloroflexales bacterium]
MHGQRIFVSDHNHEVSELFAEILSNEGYRVWLDAPAELNVHRICAALPDLALIELLPNQPVPTLNLVEQLRAHPATFNLPVLVSSTDYFLLKRLAQPLSALGCQLLMKPFTLETLLGVVRAALDPSGAPQADRAPHVFWPEFPRYAHFY